MPIRWQAGASIVRSAKNQNDRSDYGFDSMAAVFFKRL
jgi:hypothetical protein